MLMTVSGVEVDKVAEAFGKLVVDLSLMTGLTADGQSQRPFRDGK